LKNSNERVELAGMVTVKFARIPLVPETVSETKLGAKPFEP